MTPTSSFSTTVTNTVTRNFTTTVATITEFATPPVTTTIVESEVTRTTTTEVETDAVISGTITSFVDTTTTDTTSYSSFFTCPGDPALPTGSITISANTSVTSLTPRPTGSSLSFPTSSKNVTRSAGSTGSGFFPSGTGIIGTGTGIIGTGGSSSLPSSSIPPYQPPYYGPPPVITAPAYGAYGREKRQDQVFYTPACLRRLDRTSGIAGISDACNCLAIATPTPVSTTLTRTDPSTTVTSTNTIRVTATETQTPTTTATESTTRVITATSTTTTTTLVATTVPATLTVTRTSLSIITTSSPTPTSFNIYYQVNDTSPANFFQAGLAPGGDGIVLAPESQADFFTIDPMNRLVDITAGRLFIAKNTEDLYPFELLKTTADPEDTPLCEACDGELRCDYPGTMGNVFALCHGFMALGPKAILDKDADGNGVDDCVEIELRFK